MNNILALFYYYLLVYLKDIAELLKLYAKSMECISAELYLYIAFFAKYFGPFNNYKCLNNVSRGFEKTNSKLSSKKSAETTFTPKLKSLVENLETSEMSSYHRLHCDFSFS